MGVELRQGQIHRLSPVAWVDDQGLSVGAASVVRVLEIELAYVLVEYVNQPHAYGGATRAWVPKAWFTRPNPDVYAKVFAMVSEGPFIALWWVNKPEDPTTDELLDPETLADEFTKRGAKPDSLFLAISGLLRFNDKPAYFRNTETGLRYSTERAGVCT